MNDNSDNSNHNMKRKERHGEEENESKKQKTSLLRAGVLALRVAVVHAGNVWNWC